MLLNIYKDEVVPLPTPEFYLPVACDQLALYKEIIISELSYENVGEIECQTLHVPIYVCLMQVGTYLTLSDPTIFLQELGFSLGGYEKNS